MKHLANPRQVRRSIQSPRNSLELALVFLNSLTHWIQLRQTHYGWRIVLSPGLTGWQVPYQPSLSLISQFSPIPHSSAVFPANSPSSNLWLIIPKPTDKLTGTRTFCGLCQYIQVYSYNITYVFRARATLPTIKREKEEKDVAKYYLKLAFSSIF